MTILCGIEYNITAVPTLISFSNKSIKSRRDARMGVGLTSDDLDSILSDIDKDAIMHNCNKNGFFFSLLLFDCHCGIMIW